MAGRLYAAPAAAPRFLLVFLRGGYDSANVAGAVLERVLLRIATDHRDRPTRCRNERRRARARCRLGARTRRCATRIGPLYQQRQVAFVPFAGTDDLSRSHFETQDSIELGQPLERHARLPFRVSWRGCLRR